VIDVTDLRTWDAWHTQHQPYELEWWRRHLANGHSRDDAEFKRIWDEVREFIQPHGFVIDIGCGPRPPFAPCVVIEPLANEYLDLDSVKAEWWENVFVFSQPAEIKLFRLMGEADTVICWNCIDHAIGWRNILDNMRAYARPDATIAVATDFFEPFLGHPGFPRDEFMAEIEQHFEIVEKREPFGRQLALRMKVKNASGL
jgi:hypothetical protein